MVLFNSESIIAGKTHSEIVAMGFRKRWRWYKTILPEEKDEAMAIIKTAMRAMHSEAWAGDNNPSKRLDIKTKRSEFMTEKWKDPEFRSMMSGENNPAKRPDVRVKISESKMGDKNPAKRPDVKAKLREAWTPKRRAEHSAAKIEYWKDPENKAKMMGENNYFFGSCRSGENGPNWQGGLSFDPYSADFNAELKSQIRSRDNYTCQECQQTEKQLGYTLDVHHIDYNKMNSCPENLISLCRSCHSQTNFGREDWTEYFGRIAEARL